MIDLSLGWESGLQFFTQKPHPGGYKFLAGHDSLARVGKELALFDTNCPTEDLNQLQEGFLGR